jgi:Nucleotidyl transferase AbiEii toxin, Type IV TA system
VPRFRDSGPFTATIDAAAEQLDVSPTAVEKDYWVTQVLRALARDFDNDFIFKGGTSLSKGYHILERLSDDIDVLVLPGDRGKGTVDRLMKNMGEVAAEATEGQTERSGAAETGVHRAYRVSYPAMHEPTEAIRTSVLLEMGVRGGPNPHERVVVSSLLGGALEAAGTNIGDYEDLRPFEIEVLHPSRTLLEKLCLIHSLAIQVSTKAIATDQLRRHGRHFYDIFKLLGDQRVLDFLAEPGYVDQIITSIEEVSRQEFGIEGDPRPEGGFANSPAFDRDSIVSEEMRFAYEAIMLELYFGVEPLPTWSEILERVHERRELL